MPDDSGNLLPIEAVMQAGATACERFLSEAKLIETGWRENKLGDAVEKLKQRLIHEYDGDTDTGSNITAGSPVA